jgi:hypothetical protein
VGDEYNCYVYIMANRWKTIYTGVTTALESRVWQHKTKAVDGFTAPYGIERLVYYRGQTSGRLWGHISTRLRSDGEGFASGVGCQALTFLLGSLRASDSKHAGGAQCGSRCAPGDHGVIGPFTV